MRCSFYFALLVLQKNKADLQCSQKERITACSRATALQLHLPGIIPESCHDDSRKQSCNAVTYRSLESECSEAPAPWFMTPLSCDSRGLRRRLLCPTCCLYYVWILVTHLQPVGATDRSRRRPSENSLCKLFKLQKLQFCWDQVRTKHNYIQGAFLYLCCLMITIWTCTTRLGAHFTVHFSLLLVVFKVRQEK